MVQIQCNLSQELYTNKLHIHAKEILGAYLGVLNILSHCH